VVGVNVTTPLPALKLEVPATVVVPFFTVTVAVVAFARVAEITAVAGATFVASAAGVFAVSDGFGMVVNDQVPPSTAAPFAVTVTA
jgi:hypothetical protein